MSTLKTDFVEKFLVEDNGKLIFDWNPDPPLIQRMFDWLDCREKMEDELINRWIDLEDKLCAAEARIRELEEKLYGRGM